VQFSSVRLGSTEGTSGTTGWQVTYQNSASLTLSLVSRCGFLVAAEWDAPVYSDPLRGSAAYRANTATFTAGFVYNYYAGKYTSEFSKPNNPWAMDRWGLSLLYSYTAFDPFTETNQLQLKISYSF
jgi:hypothetical protein